MFNCPKRTFCSDFVVGLPNTFYFLAEKWSVVVLLATKQQTKESQNPIKCLQYTVYGITSNLINDFIRSLRENKLRTLTYTANSLPTIFSKFNFLYYIILYPVLYYYYIILPPAGYHYRRFMRFGTTYARARAIAINVDVNPKKFC